MGVIILRVQEGLDFSDFFGPSFFKPIVPKSIETSANGDVPQHLESILEMKESKSEKFSGDSDASHPLKPFAMTMNVTKTPTNGFKNNFDQMKKLIPMDAMEAINQFSLKQKSGHIDIWWLTEDGGLIVLIPYLLHISYNWSACSIRIFCLTKTTENIEETKQNMTELVKRLRIPYKDIVVISEVEFKPSEQRFRAILNDSIPYLN
ncbi:hypothetical protein QR98_0067340 [Sarcoptes scabiei]|uniref:SLC12A transporter C-terminal domain-containing protein n=1 Tax=Sarcoptes scabiei TaxID=52283 RepID=A0A132ACP5_SARSC|nr:hypothetical protein QR98_0067340 [Sarcoptes scabiei]